MKNMFWVAASLALVGNLAAAQSVATDASLIQVNSVLWTQQAVERRAASVAIYRAAGAELIDASKRAGWASLEKGSATLGRKAVVMDVDETVLDNSPYNAWLIQKNFKYEESTWQDWVALRKAVAIPGALEFVRLAKKLKVDVFFVTNRECVPKNSDPCPALAHTRRNLIDLGFERAADADALMLIKQRPQWSTSDKSTRRQLIAQTHQIVMMVGDDMGDFLPVAKVTALRADTPDPETTKAMTQLGKRWFVIPNPMNGPWERALPATAAERIALFKAPAAWSGQPPPTGALASSASRRGIWLGWPTRY